jgi:hypothetical protein
MVSGWSTYEKLVCPYCMDNNNNNNVFILINDGKIFFVLPLEVLVKSSLIQTNKKNDFLKDKVASLVLSGKEVRNEVLQYEGIVFDFHYSKKKINSFCVTHNWVKQIIF